MLSGAADPHQVGALLMLLRYRGEDPEEIAGLVEGAREAEALGRCDEAPPVALDWPSYGSGRTRGAPWFLLAALTLARAGIPVLMHGSNEFSSGITVSQGLHALGIPQAETRRDAWHALGQENFAYLPAAALSPGLERLLALRHLLGLRSPVNTVARLLNPADADASVDGVFHPPYIALHLAVAELLGRPRLLVLKGGGGEAERPPAKPVSTHLWVADTGRSELSLPALVPSGERSGDTVDLLAAVWRGEATPDVPVATVVGTIAMALLALGRVDGVEAADRIAGELWKGRGTIRS